jgi:hypothetical protein
MYGALPDYSKEYDEDELVQFQQFLKLNVSGV